jgi:hypothetical protein
MPTDDANRRRFWKRAFLKGASWTNTVVGAGLNVAVILAGVGLVLADYLPKSWLVVVGFVAALLLIGLAEGAYEVWEETEKHLAEAKALLDRRAYRRSTLKWLGKRLEVGSELMKRFQTAAMGEAERIAEEFRQWDDENVALFKERLPEFAPEYGAPVLATEDRRNFDSWRAAAFNHLQLRLQRLMEIREQFRTAVE